MAFSELSTTGVQEYNIYLHSYSNQIYKGKDRQNTKIR